MAKFANIVKCNLKTQFRILFDMGPLKHISNLAIGIVTFLLGIFGYGLTVLSYPITSIEAIAVDRIPINACSLETRADHFLHRPIVVDALLFHNHESVVVYVRDGVDCGRPDPAHGYSPQDFNISFHTILDLSQYRGPNSDVAHLLRTKRKGFQTDVRIEGSLFRSPTNDYPGRHALVPTRIILASPWQTFTAKGAA